MKIKNLILSLAVGALCGFMLSNCGSKSAMDADYISVKVDNSNMWSLLDVENGKMAFTDEFFAPATNVVKNAFFVQNDDGTFDLYNIENTKNKLNRDSYTFVTNFSPDGFSIVRVKTEPWQIVNTTGQVIATLDKNLGVASGFGPDGLALIFNKDKKFGFINTKGEIVIKPRYENAKPFSDGVSIVITRTENGKSFFEAIDKAGTTLFKGNTGQYSKLTPFENGYCFAVEGDHIVLLDKTGKKVVSVNEGTSLTNLSVNKDKFIYFDKEFYGVKDLTGKIVIRAKYPSLKFLGDGNLKAINSNGKTGVVNTNDEIIIPFEYDNLDYLAPNRYLTSSGSVIILINKDGKEICDQAFAQVVNRSESASLDALVKVLSSSNNQSVTTPAYESNSFDFSNIDSMLSEFDSEDSNEDNNEDNVDVESYADDSAYSSSESKILNLTGSFGKYPVTVSLRIKGSDVTGSYYYTKSGSGSPITLEGFMIDPITMSVNEMVGGKSTGSWNLSLGYHADNKIDVTGKMINYNGKEFDVNLSGTVSE